MSLLHRRFLRKRRRREQKRLLDHMNGRHILRADRQRYFDTLIDRAVIEAKRVLAQSLHTPQA